MSKISAYTAATAPLGATDVMPCSIGGTTTKKVTADQIKGVADQSQVASSHTGDTAEFTLATITLPVIGPNGKVRVTADFTYPSTANVKTLKIKLGSTVLWTSTPTTTTSCVVDLMLGNRNSNSSQRWNSRHFLSSAAVGIQAGTAAVDLSAGGTITITAQLGLSSETITLESRDAVISAKS